MKSKLADIAQAVNVRLAYHFDTLLAQQPAELFFPAPQLAITDEVRALTLRGGKRIRAALMTAGYELFAGNALKNNSLVDCACAMELLQTYFLIHDDIMDNDAERRGGPSVHVSLSNTFRNETVGRNQAILAGDLANALHELILAKLSCDASVQTAVQYIFSRMHVDVVLGQSLDLLGNAAPEDVVQRKTASYTTIGPLCVGASLAGANSQQLRAVANMATPLGIAFQYRDDYIGVFGNTDNLGKPKGSDIKNNKRTLLIDDAMRMSDEPGRSALRFALGNNDATDEDLQNAINAIEVCGAKARCETQIDTLSDTAFAQLRALEARAFGKPFMEWLIGRLAERNS
ncbi:MAG: polyprenyl synthetase family protein [Deltaproteobacteria bacterium]|nr:polyprenyl synthetase family protein [Deltaproteobacteria bacterium]MBN2672826.1 polyprenyl synthetase family protein [Deltaproteobacteria bacterium]